MKDYPKVPTRIEPLRPWPDPPAKVFLGDKEIKGSGPWKMEGDQEKTHGPKRRLVIVTEPPPEGQIDSAPKEFEGAREIANILEMIVVAMRSEPKKYPVVSTWCGRKIISITFTQKEEDDGVSAAHAAKVCEDDGPGKGPRRCRRCGFVVDD